jgi:hypothetical protein
LEIREMGEEKENRNREIVRRKENGNWGRRIKKWKSVAAKN